MTGPPSGWWTCQECRDWNSPHSAPTRCGGCGEPRYDDEEAPQAPLFIKPGEWGTGIKIPKSFVPTERKAIFGEATGRIMPRAASKSSALPAGHKTRDKFGTATKPRSISEILPAQFSSVESSATPNVPPHQPESVRKRSNILSLLNDDEPSEQTPPTPLNRESGVPAVSSFKNTIPPGGTTFSFVGTEDNLPKIHSKTGSTDTSIPSIPSKIPPNYQKPELKRVSMQFEEPILFNTTKRFETHKEGDSGPKNDGGLKKPPNSPDPGTRLPSFSTLLQEMRSEDIISSTNLKRDDLTPDKDTITSSYNDKAWDLSDQSNLEVERIGESVGLSRLPTYDIEPHLQTQNKKIEDDDPSKTTQFDEQDDATMHNLRIKDYNENNPDNNKESIYEEEPGYPELKKRRGRAAPPGRCHSCDRVETPEWRRGPDGARTLCNACGLQYAKMTRNKVTSAGIVDSSNAQMYAQMLAQPELMQQRTAQAQAAAVEAASNENDLQKYQRSGSSKESYTSNESSIHPKRSFDEPSVFSQSESVFSTAGSDSSLSGSVFSADVSSSSLSSVEDTQGYTEQLAKLVFEDDVLQQLCLAAIDVIPRERFETELRRALRRLYLDLRKEATCLPERQAAKFVGRLARDTAHLVCDEINAARAFQKKRQAAPPRAWKQSSDSDSSENEDEVADIQEARRFIQRSQAFSNFRQNVALSIHKLVNALREEEEFVNQELFKEMLFFNLDLDSDLHQEDSLKGLRWNFHRSWKRLSKLKSSIFRPPKLAKGSKRVCWKCPCGTTGYDDYVELIPGEAKRFQRALQRNFKIDQCTDNIHQHPQIINNGVNAVTRFLVPISTLPKLAWDYLTNFKNRTQDKLPLHEMRTQPSQDPSAQQQLSAIEELFLLMCVNNSAGSSRTGLSQPPVHIIDSDRQFFSLMKAEYTSLRSRWWSFLSLWSLRQIHFVHFEMYDPTIIDVKEANSLPQSRIPNEYKYETCNLRPPVGSNILKHFMMHPSCAAVRRPYFDKVPKKIGQRLAVDPDKGVSPGWGLHFVEGWNWKKIFVAYLVFLVTSLLTALVFILLHYSIQDSFAIAGWTLAAFTLGITTLQVIYHLD